MINKIKNIFSKKKTIDKPIKTNTIRVGSRFYSNYFKEYGTVIKVVNETHWYFRLDNSNKVLRSTTRLDYFTWITTER